MKKQIAFFDFDGTITTRDTLLEFIKFSKGKLSFYIGWILNSPWLVAYKLKIISNQAAKERILSFFFSRTPLARFEQYCLDFADRAIPSLLRPKALAEISRLQQLGIPVVIVSASPENWIRPWADRMQLELIATRLQVKKDELTGKINGRNCHGEEKLRRIELQYTLSDYEETYAYGDSSGDRPMLAAAKISFYKPFL